MPSESPTKEVSWLNDLIVFVFSGFVLSFVSVIVSGLVFNKIIPFSANEKNRIRFPIFILNLEADGGAVVWGFLSFLPLLFFVSIFFGPSVYVLVDQRFGFHTTQLNALCFFSALLLTIISLVVYLIWKVSNARPKTVIGSRKTKHDDRIEKLGRTKQ